MKPAEYSSLQLDTPECLENYFAARSSLKATTTVTPISSHGFQALATVVTTPKVRVEHAKWSSIRVDGIVSENSFTFVPFLRSSERNSVWGRPILTHDLSWTPPGRDRCANYPDPLEVIAVTVPFETVLSKCDSRGLDVEQLLRARNSMIAAPATACKAIAVGAFDMLHAAAKKENKLSTTRVELGVDMLLGTFLDTLAQIEDAVERPRTRFGSFEKLVRETDDLLLERHREIIEVSQAAEALGVSRVTLHRAFSEVVGTSPGKYLRNWRLSRSRQELLECKFSNVTECSVAWGFLDVGRFAGYYHELFSEMPSDTLRRALGNSATKSN